MPYGSKTPEYDWRLTINKGDIIDVCDTSNVWYNSTVLDVRATQGEDDHDVREIHVGYRIYVENGDKFDVEGRKFVGWSSRYDEWLSATNPRVQPYAKCDYFI